MIVYTSKFPYEALEFSDPVPKLGDFVNVWIVPNRGIVNFVHTETGLVIMTDECQR